ncbi:hypothetical protein B0J18DRAFT_436860 [Chaetomium sp. MPI-SDFR-AT-0129]|nr:hypothetical protein B0J18DRAFT_436860 [Chaetomium sp. MPI-SDFR-AT-0129]
MIRTLRTNARFLTSRTGFIFGLVRSVDRSPLLITPQRPFDFLCNLHFSRTSYRDNMSNDDRYYRYTWSPGLTMPMAPDTKAAKNPLFKELRQSVTDQTMDFTFTCGGLIPIVPELPDETQKDTSSEVDKEIKAEANDSKTCSNEDDGTAQDDGSSNENNYKYADHDGRSYSYKMDYWDHIDVDQTRSNENLRARSCLPIDLRWDSEESYLLSSETKLTLPLEPKTEKNLGQLIKDMTPATFGRGGEHVYDESYRKASKLDPSHFASTFNPYELGIVDTIAQTLLPSLRHSEQTRAVKAELYKMNIYSGPSAKFKAHVDTPRSPSQFGSLVVCLPLEHQGGALEVRHNGKTVTFDWSNAKGDGKPPVVGWAAFYSDCEHEVLEVTDGHRLTLTYNLFCVRGNGQLGGNCPWLDPVKLPLYQTIKALVQDPDAWEQGGYIGFNCSHAYPHTAETTLNFLAPDNLKGADMLMYEIFLSLGLKVHFRPVAHDLHVSDNEGAKPPVVGLDLKRHLWEGQTDDEYLMDHYNRWTGRFPSDFEQNYWGKQKPEPDPVPEYVPFDKVHWLNDFGHMEPSISWIAYGNEPSNMITYSCCAIIAEIPPAGKEQDKADEAKGGEAEAMEDKMEGLMESKVEDQTEAASPATEWTAVIR